MFDISERGGSVASNGGFSPELIAEAQRIVDAPYTKTIPWTGTSQMLVACGPGLEARKFASAFLEAVKLLEAKARV